MKSLIIVDCQ